MTMTTMTKAMTTMTMTRQWQWQWQWCLCLWQWGWQWRWGPGLPACIVSSLALVAASSLSSSSALLPLTFLSYSSPFYHIHHLFIIFITFLSYSSAQKLRFWARPMHRQDMLLVKGTCLFFGIWYMIYHQYSSCQAPPPLHARALSLKTTTIKSLTKMSIPSFSRSSCASLMVRSLSSKAASISLRNSCPRLASIAFSIRGRRHQHQKLDYLLILPTWVWETPPPPFFWEKFPNDPYFCHEHLHHHFYFPITLF